MRAGENVLVLMRQTAGNYVDLSGQSLSLYFTFINVHSNLILSVNTGEEYQSSCVKITFIQDEKYNM